MGGFAEGTAVSESSCVVFSDRVTSLTAEILQYQ